MTTRAPTFQTLAPLESSGGISSPSFHILDRRFLKPNLLAPPTFTCGGKARPAKSPACRASRHRLELPLFIVGMCSWHPPSVIFGLITGSAATPSPCCPTHLRP
ncbi:hypothetical protein BS78_05G133200 [Paspalum vaginatum]|nr:hypothetical protein BS78_05G133200 [Paspalum vaginatum]